MSRPTAPSALCPSPRRFTRKEGGASLAIITLTVFFFGIVMAPLLAQTQEQADQSFCTSNLKQLELGFLMYSQDYDEKFPPAAEPLTKGSKIVSGWAVTHDTAGKAAVPLGTSETNIPFAHGPVFPYVKTTLLFRCPSTPTSSGPLSYMMNDLASGAGMAKIASPARTVLLCDGEDFAGNAGHAYAPIKSPAPAKYSPKGAVILGATLQTAPTRHQGGANYGFVDGHVKWFKPQAVFFPPRSSSPSHKDARTGRILGPDPLHLSEKGLNATFHLH